MSRVGRSSLVGFAAMVLHLILTPQVSLGQRAAVQGQVKGLDGKPVEGAVIQLDNVEIERRYTVKTNKKGRYFHGSILLGYYRVSVHVNGKELHAVPRVRIAWTSKPGEQRGFDAEPVRVDFDLQKLTAAARQRQAELAQRSDVEKARDLERDEERKFGHMNEEFKRGRELRRARRHQEALAAFAKAAAIDPRQHVIFANMGEVHRELRKYDQAIASYRQALQVLTQKPDPEVEAKYQMNLGTLLGLSGETDEALAAIHKALELNPGDAAQAYFNLGATLVNGGKAEGAAQSFRKAVEANPDHANAQYQLGICLVSLASVTEDGQTVPVPGTIEAFKRYVELEPAGRHAAQARSMIQALSGQVKTTYEAKKGKQEKR